MKRGPASRRAITLLEMVLALALFLGAISVLAQIAWNGQRAAIQARLQTEAVFRCESKLAEVLSGAVPFQSQSGVAFPDDSHWTWSAQIAPGNFPELLHVKVLVHHQSLNATANLEYVLERWVRDPTLFLSAAEAQSASQVSKSPTSTSTQSGGGSK